MKFEEIKIPKSREENDKLRKSLRFELGCDDLETVSGGRGTKQKNAVPFTCPFCGAVIMCTDTQEANKHIAMDCSNNPYR